MTLLHQFFERARAGELTAIRCEQCGVLAIPPKEFCPSCGERAWQAVALVGTGTITSYTVIRVPSRTHAEVAPYAVALVQLTEGVSLLGRVVDLPLEAVRVGLPVRFRPLVEQGRTAIGFGPTQ